MCFDIAAVDATTFKDTVVQSIVLQLPESRYINNYNLNAVQ